MVEEDNPQETGDTDIVLVGKCGGISQIHRVTHISRVLRLLRHHLEKGEAYCLRLNYSGDMKTRNNHKSGNLGCIAKVQCLCGK